MALGTLAFFDPLGWKKAQETKELANQRVLVVGDEKVSAIKIHNQQKEVRLICTNAGGCPFDYSGAWKVSAPVSDLGDSSNIGSLLSSLSNLAVVGRVDAEKSDWANYGLDAPKQFLELELTNGKSLYFGFGEDSAIGSNRYLRTNINDKEVYLVASFFANQLANEVYHWRNKRILRTVETENISSISWDSIAANRSAGNWLLTKPYKVPANRVMLEGALNTILYANGKRIISENGVLPPGAKKILSVELGLKEGKKNVVSVFTLASKDAAMQVNGSKIVYAVDPVPFERLKKQPEEFRFQRLLSVEEKNAANEITMRFPKEKQELKLVKQDLTWQRVGGVELKENLSQARINDFLDALSGLDPARFVRDAAKLKRFHGLADFELVLGGRTLRFVLDERKSALANGDISGEARLMGENFLKTLPVRLSDLYESTNKRVVVSEPEKNGDDHEHHAH